MIDIYMVRCKIRSYHDALVVSDNFLHNEGKIQVFCIIPTTADQKYWFTSSMCVKKETGFVFYAMIVAVIDIFVKFQIHGIVTKYQAQYNRFETKQSP